MVELGVAHLADAMMLPFLMFVDGDGKWLDGASGSVQPERFRAALVAAVADAGLE